MRYLIFPILLGLILFLSNGYTQDWTTWGLPEGAKRRIGKGDISYLRFSPDGNRLAVSTTIVNNRLLLWDVRTQRVLSELVEERAGVGVLAFSPDGAILVSEGFGGTLHLWDVSAGILLSSIKAHPYGIVTLKFSPDGTTLASGGMDNTILLWDREKIAPATGR